MPFSAARTRPSTTLSTWAVSVTLRPPPTQANLPASTVVDHLRQQRRVALAPDEARAHDHGLEALAAGVAHRQLGLRLGRRVGGRESGRSGAVSSTWTSGSPAISAASVPQWTKRRTPASAQAAERVAGALDVAALEVLPRPPLAEVGGEVEGDVAAGGAGGERGAVAEVAAHRLGAERRDPRGGGVGAGQRPHRPSFGDQPLDQPAADEPGAAGDEDVSAIGRDVSLAR